MISLLYRKYVRIYYHQIIITEETERSHEGDSAVGMPLTGTIADAELGDASQLIFGEQE